MLLDRAWLDRAALGAPSQSVALRWTHVQDQGGKGRRGPQLKELARLGEKIKRKLQRLQISRTEVHGLVLRCRGRCFSRRCENMEHPIASIWEYWFHSAAYV